MKASLEEGFMDRKILVRWFLCEAVDEYDDSFLYNHIYFFESSISRRILSLKRGTCLGMAPEK